MMTKQNKINWKVTCSAIAGIVILDGIALIMGHNGVLLTGAVAVIAGLAGYKIKN